ncbi:MAG: LpxL/LpxP family Kdo(2)-lipid IV(A) lauroyl/palmitoleoyl acyltransferase [Gammaproteobacteria bacterium]|nr:LpxL/LpxP family Kdo(2)-lipid IV(A) lauroyl/palmitoleoyl acyltransferase [Gammaproteobacteria bacterium]
MTETPRHSQQPPSGIKYWPTRLFFFFLKGLTRLPYSWLLGLGRAIGILMYHLANSRTRIARVNIKKCFPQMNEAAQEALVRKNLISTSIGMIETAILWFGPKRNWEDRFEINGLEHLENALNEGKGALLLAFHLTSLEIGGSLLSTKCYLGALYRRNENPLIEHVMVKGRSQYVHSIPREQTREMVKWLRNNGVVWYAADQDYGRKQSVFVPFFNIPTATITATTRFTKLSKAPVIPMTQTRIDGGKRIRIDIHSPFESMGQDEQQDAIKINQFLEKYLETHPEDYLWVHRRFKTRPSESDLSFYPTKKKNRPVTPERLKNILNVATDIKTENDRVTELKVDDSIVKFIYHSNFIDRKAKINRLLKTFDKISDNGQEYYYQGRIRRCDSLKATLVYYEK